MQNKIRCINDNTGQVRYLSESVANNRGFMKNYGWRIEDVKELEKEIPPLENSETEAINPEPIEAKSEPVKAKSTVKSKTKKRNNGN